MTNKEYSYSNDLENGEKKKKQDLRENELTASVIQYMNSKVHKVGKFMSRTNAFKLQLKTPLLKETSETP
jgi:hypothetical protein